MTTPPTRLGTWFLRGLATGDWRHDLPLLRENRAPLPDPHVAAVPGPGHAGATPESRNARKSGPTQPDLGTGARHGQRGREDERYQLARGGHEDDPRS